MERWSRSFVLRVGIVCRWTGLGLLHIRFDYSCSRGFDELLRPGALLPKHFIAAPLLRNLDRYWGALSCIPNDLATNSTLSHDIVLENQPDARTFDIASPLSRELTAGATRMTTDIGAFNLNVFYAQESSTAAQIVLYEFHPLVDRCLLYRGIPIWSRFRGVVSFYETQEYFLYVRAPASSFRVCWLKENK